MEWHREIAEGLRPIVDLVYPPRCPLCGAALARQGGLCIDCWSGIEAPGEGGHGAPYPTPIAATLYNETSRQLVLRLKHGRKLALADLMAQMLAARLPDPDPSTGSAPLLVPVPLHRLRLWQRGFNQAALLARALAKRGKGELLVDALVRPKRTPSLGGLGREARNAVLKGAIAINARRRGAVDGRAVILVDDVLTSGATSAACVAALQLAGARSVTIACFAQVADGAG
jgi:ComF family protein